jgi:hypothetical protein
MAAKKKSKKSKKPSKAEFEKLRKELEAVTKAFWANYGKEFDFLMVGPPGPRPPPKMEFTILNMSSY